MRVIVTGGDGFCGWPCALGLSAAGHEVVIIDNLMRRAADAELGTASLTAIATPGARLAAWRRVSGRGIALHGLDLTADHDALHDLLRAFRPDAVVHCAAQRSAPYSMRSAAHKRLTLANNLGATHALLAALVETGIDAHVVHLSSIGVYGYSGERASIPEGYVRVALSPAEAPREILYPAEPGSIYHLTKAQEQLLFGFYCRNDGLRITCLQQGIVWGSQTADTLAAAELINRFDYDGIYGTVVHRFLVQAALGAPLTVHGDGGQSRGFIHLRDAMHCIALALATPPGRGERPRILNQVGEVLRVGDLARRVAAVTGATVMHIDNPRNEAGDHTFPVEATTLRGLGLRPTGIDAASIGAEMAIVQGQIGRIDPASLPARVRWR